MEEDDMDFTPSTKTSSNLATLFGFTKKPLKGNSSLTYTAPKAPKRESSPAKKQSEEKTKGKIIFSTAVQAYKLENRTYVNQGLIGIVISGNHDSHSYEIILYKRTKEHLNQIKISNNFSITLSLNNYVSFYDNNKQNWSIMFQSSADVEQFSQKVAICKFYSSSEPLNDILIQDLGPASQKKTSPNSAVEVVYNSYTLIPEELTKLRSEVKEKIKLSDCNVTYLSKGLIGCAENCKRIIIIPHSLSGPWLNELCTNKDLLIEAKVEKIIAEENSVFDSKLLRPESPVDSSAEETSIKSKGALIRESLSSTKSQKANLISRMARMGQATLPVKQELSAGPSDSEEEGSMTSTPKPRLPRNRNTVANPPMNNLFSQIQNPEASQQLSVYQNDSSWEQTQLGVQKLGVAYQQIIPVSASPITSPSADPNLSVYVSESRVQAAELRMGISKISEKLDLVWNKIQNMSSADFENKTHHKALMDSGGILTSIQNLFTENESLKKKVEEQKEKIEQQNDRIYSLLELNHKYLEQNSTTHEKQSASELRLKAEVESLREKELEMETANKTALGRMKNLEEDLTKSEELNKELTEKIEALKLETEELKKINEKCNESAKESESLQEKIWKASETIIKLKEKLREVISENQNLKSVIKAQKEEIETGGQEMINSRTKNQEYEKTMESLKNLISEEKSKAESEIENLSKLVAKLEEQNKSLMERKGFEKDAFISGVENDQNKIKNVLQKILSVLRDQFKDPKEYSSSHALAIIEKVFTDVVNKTYNLEEALESSKVELFVAKPAAVPAARASLLNSEPLQKEEEEGEKRGSTKPEVEDSKISKEFEKKEENGEIEDVKIKDEVDSRYKSYDQGWRTAKPPPPPLFDDEDDDDDWLN